MYDSKEISRVSKNLSLRLSPERKYSPKKVCTICCLYPCRCCPICHDLPCRCCYHCHCCPCTCFLHSPHRIRTSSPLCDSSPNLNSIKKTYPYGNHNNSSFIDSTNFGTYHSPSRYRSPIRNQSLNISNINTKNDYNNS